VRALEEQHGLEGVRAARFDRHLLPTVAVLQRSCCIRQALAQRALRATHHKSLRKASLD
jgi:hypothetical protein